MPVAAAIGAAGALGSAGIGAYGASQASKQQAGAQQNAINAQNALFNRAMNIEQPFITAGQGAVQTLSGLLTPGPSQTQTLSQLPGFQFAQDWGQKAVQNIGSTQGFGGNTLTAGAQYATGLAQQGFGQYAGLLQNLANTGASGANAVLGGAVQTGANLGQSYTGLGQAQAAGTLGVANAFSGGLTGATNAATNALILPQLLSRMQGFSNPTDAGIYGGVGSGGYNFLDQQAGTPASFGR